MDTGRKKSSVPETGATGDVPEVSTSTTREGKSSEGISVERVWEIKIGEAGYTICFERFNAWYQIVINGVQVTEKIKDLEIWDYHYPFRFNGHHGQIILFSNGWIQSRPNKCSLVIDGHVYVDERKSDRSETGCTIEKCC